jgi:hypothetical protein
VFKTWSTGTDEVTYANRFVAATQTWSGPVRIEDPAMTGLNDYRQSIAGGSDTLIIAYTRDSETMFAAIYDPVAGAWKAPVALSGTDYFCYNSTACDPAGNGTIVFKNYNTYQIFAVRYY